ncbi:SRPBCC family protein [Flavihumibacter profundi]|uniref:SRPBCC family protein n=1 Tax=Flavihumibacter profundi TaxID=2716883 RepID=UPI001CC75BC7|nr:SRPBCC family protein [Flavihumibacter profundi]MBZ5857442.1 SRPBCC family protein [Flavihumibacter profundi]
MPTIHLTTFVQAPMERVFDLSRSIDLHKKSMAHTGEEAVGGTTMGLINNQETVTWKAKHLGKTRILKSKITEMKKPLLFTDEMAEGDFRSMKHDHHFKSVDNGTLMIDYLHYEMPYGFIGRLVDQFYLNKYLTRLLETRNSAIKKCAETDQWKRFIG